MDANRGRVVTFYAYKGGTGRSMALANVACLLARRTEVKRVLAVDWDLDAPGLHHFLPPVGESPQKGLGNLFVQLTRTFSQTSEPLAENATAQIVAGLNLAEFITPTQIRNVDLLPAGQLTDWV